MNFFPGKRERGGVLMTVLIFTSVIAVSLTSYVRLATNAYQAAQRNFLETAAASLAEIGLEHALSAFNHIDDLGQLLAFTTWTTNTNGTATLTLDAFDLGGGVTGVVKIYVNGWNQGILFPQVIAKATLTQPNGPGITRYLQVSLRRRTPFVGLVATGNLKVNTLLSYFAAWNSLPNGFAQPAVGYSTASALPNCFIGVVGGGTASFNNALIFGTIANDTTIAKVTHGGASVLASTLGGSGWNNALYSDSLAISPTVPIAPTLPAIYNPVATAIKDTTTFPRTGDRAAADGSYYYDFAAGAGISLSSLGEHIKISAGKNCVLRMQNHAGTDAIKTSGFAGVTIENNGTLKIYTNGNIDCTGLAGVSNANNSSTSFILYGTNPAVGGQTFEFTGIGAFIGSVNAPNADLTWTGVNLWMGSVVAHNITFSLAGGFIYDTAMAQVVNTTGTGNAWGIGQWSELTTSTQRGLVAGLLNF